VAIEGPVRRDKGLLPRAGLRLAALGLLASEGPRTYANLAQAVRQFTGTFQGPTLDVMSSSIELLRFEGLIDVAGDGAEGTNATVAITDAGRGHLKELLLAPVRSPSGDFNKLVIALKLRYLHALGREDRRDQLAALGELCLAERARLVDLRARDNAASATFRTWLDHEIAEVEADVALFERLSADDRSD